MSHASAHSQSRSQAQPLPVSRETEALIDRDPGQRAYLTLLLKWQARINLIGPATQQEALNRHLRDSLQLLGFFQAEPAERLLDLGSGGGLPAIPLALAFQHLGWSHRLTLVESDKRKSAFLRQAARVLELPLTVESQRLETMKPWLATTITARAFAPLPRLLQYSQGFIGPETRLLLLKGERWREEVEHAALDYDFHCAAYQSSTHEAGVVLEIRQLQPR